MSLRKETPCDNGTCPYDAQSGSSCEFHCGQEEEPDDYFGEDIAPEDLEEYNADPYKGVNELVTELRKQPCSKCGGTDFETIYHNAVFSRFDNTCKSCGYVRYSIPD